MLRLLILLILLSPPTRAAEITVAVAISLKDAMESIAAAYKTDTTHDIKLQFGSSGQLLAQIKSGAPIDLFISAAEKQIDDAVAADLALPDTRRVIAGNSLVLIVPSDAKDAPRAFTDLPATKGRLAIGDPRTVPAGDYASQLFSSLNLTQSLQTKLVYGVNVRQVLDYVRRGEVAAGIVYKTDALEAGGAVRVVATADPKLHKPIVYPTVVLRHRNRQEDAKRFLDYLTTERAGKILADKGFAEVKGLPGAPNAEPRR